MMRMTRQWVAGMLLIATLASVDGSSDGSTRTTAPPDGNRSTAKMMNTKFDHHLFTNVLREVVDEQGQVDYARLKADPRHLNAYLAQLAEASPESRPELFPTPADQLAYWLNAYNAFVLKGVLGHYPIKTVWQVDLGLFFKRRRFVAGGKKYSLDGIEHHILRARFGESRIHFAINCASASCPVLPPAAFEREDVDARLDQATRQFLRSGQNLRIDHQRRTIYLSKILKWYANDFARTEAAGANKHQAVIAFVARYLGLDPEPLAGYRIRHLRYDWSLNDRSGRSSD